MVLTTTICERLLMSHINIDICLYMYILSMEIIESLTAL